MARTPEQKTEDDDTYVADAEPLSPAPVEPLPTDTLADTLDETDQSVTQVMEAQLKQPMGVERQQSVLREVTVTLLITLVLFLGLHYSAQAVPLDGPSMQPGLHTDERVLVNSLAYSFHGPNRGDIVVFHPPTVPNERYIKRIIGLPGDTITLTPDAVMVNGYKLSEPYITPAPPGESENPEPQTFTLGASQYFVMGDNRTNSQDSRYFGPIGSSAIIGQAQFVVWPVSNLHMIDTYSDVYDRVPAAKTSAGAFLSAPSVIPGVIPGGQRAG